MLKIGSHVHFSKDQLLGSAKETIEYGANTFMFYTGAPQNTVRTGIDEKLTSEAHKLMEENGIDIKDVVCHAPYIVNLANNKDMEKYQFSINFLINELKRCKALGVDKVVLHPGSAVGIEKGIALKNIIYGLNIILDSTEDVMICLETMAGKGTELGTNIEELRTIIDGITIADRIGICLDTCHLNDSGINIEEFDNYLDELDRVIGIDKIKVIHINDSKNPIFSHKDRHENIGFGTIGFETLIKVIYNDRLKSIPKILETPYVGVDEDSSDRSYPPYKFEIDMIRKKEFNPNLLEEIRTYYTK